MPELPEVEVARQGIAPHVEGRKIAGAAVRDGRLRQPVNPDFSRRIEGQKLQVLWRRGKYLVGDLEQGQLLIHLGMSGHLRILSSQTPPAAHDHVDIHFAGEICLRFHDPRRFGLILWGEDFRTHPLLRNLGPEPLGPDFSGSHLFRRSRGRTQAVKAFLMDAQTVVGVGNIYANESLFLAGLDPRRPAGGLGLTQCRRLAASVREVLSEAIAQGGTTLRDFARPDGRNGYFRLSLRVYGKEGEPCPRCARPLAGLRIGGRASVFCTHCQC